MVKTQHDKTKTVYVPHEDIEWIRQNLNKSLEDFELNKSSHYYCHELWLTCSAHQSSPCTFRSGILLLCLG